MKERRLRYVWMTMLAVALCLGLVSFVGAPSYGADGVAIDETNFPDAVFRAEVKEHVDVNPKDGMLGREEVEGLVSFNLYDKNIKNLKGIEHFTNLANLDVSLNELSSLDVSKNKKLTQLDCSYNNLKILDVSNNTSLNELYCNNNQLTSLDLSQTKVNQTSFHGASQVYTVKVNQKRAFLLSKLPSGFEQRKTSAWKGGKVKGDTLTFHKNSGEVSYQYDGGNGCKLGVLLVRQTFIRDIDFNHGANAITYTGKTRTPSIQVYDSESWALKEGVDYTVKWPMPRKKIGKYTVTVSFKGSYKDQPTEKATFEIVPKKLKISAKTCKKGVKVKWKKVPQATGYEIDCIDAKTYKVKTITVKGGKKSSKLIKGLKSKKKYYIVAYSYKVVKGEKIYSFPSNDVTVKTK